MPIADLLISRVSPGVVTAISTDPFSTLAVHRIERSSWKETPNVPGVYLLYGLINDRPAAYVGMSTTNILEPDARFTVLDGSHFRRATLNESNVKNNLQVVVERTQQKLADDGVVDLSQLIFLKDHTFENWSRAAYVISGKGSYSGGYHWQRIE